MLRADFPRSVSGHRGAAGEICSEQIIALAGFLLTLAAFWPGYLSWDSAYQWWQARGAPLDPAHPPVMVHLWRAVRTVLPDPGGMLAVQAAVWWAAIALWDLAAVSIGEERLLFPPVWVDPALTVADLRRDFVPYVNVPSFEHGQLKLNFYFDYTPAQFAELRAAWLALPFDHPRAYWMHRARLSAYLLGLRQDEHPDGLVISPGIVAFADNPPLVPNDGAVHRVVQPALSRLVDTPVFAAWPYLVASLAIVTGALVRRAGSTPRGLAGVVAASGLCLAAPLAVLSPSSDFRYLLWSVFAALLAAALWFAPRRPAPF